MRVDRHFTTQGKGPYDGIAFRKATSEIRNPDGSIVFQLKDIEVPAAWSQVASDILAQKYFRKAGVPARLKKVEETSVPSWLWRSVADEAALAELPVAERYTSEMTAQQVFNRLAGTWTYWGWKGGYFDGEDDALAFYEELVHMLATQRCAPNSPQWFNTGLHWAYGIDGPGQGHYYVDFETGKLTKSTSSYEHPQPHACFIQSISDDLVNEGGIMDLWVREARLFKYGSGTGSNFSFIRGENEPLSGGGKSSGLMSFLKIGDRAAGAIKSGGTTRRAAKMVVVDIDHPDIEAYIDWKVKEEEKVAALVTGSKTVQKHLKVIMKACVNCEGPAGDCYDPAKNPALKRAIKDARKIVRAGRLHQARAAVCRAGLHRDRVRHLRHRLGRRSLPHRVGPELQQLGARHRRVPARGRDRLVVGPQLAHARRRRPHRRCARPVGEGRQRRVGLRRPRHPVPHHHQRLAHLPGVGCHPRVQPVLGVHVP
jgi:ribonucleoside-diphosphate reductase alpha chain